VYIVFEEGLVLIDVDSDVVGVVMFRRIMDASMERAFNLLARGLSEFFEECGGEVEWGVMRGV